MSELSIPNPRKAALTEALLRIVAERGLDQVSVREVASAADVSIGTVQHYFPTKDEMLAAAFAEVVRQVRARLASVERGDDIRRNLSTVLREFLPLDARRSEEARIMLAFATRAATSPALAEVQRSVLGEIHEALSEALTGAAYGHVDAADVRSAAHIAIAAADGLALHAVSAPGWMSRGQLAAALELLLERLVPERADPVGQS
ncbi:MAG TPA: TetR/AcrR family transcriptional regulator [Solirubrobacterales bacterium]|nr:TetR/AcrR family transcriptional regulator [Solirubrobacterales bacterium]